MNDVTLEALEKVFSQPPGEVELLLIGAGERLVPIPSDIKSLLQAKSIRSDPMATAHAVSTYNILLGEKRKVAAALIAAM